MIGGGVETLRAALTAFRVHRSPAKIASALRASGMSGLKRDLESLDQDSRTEIEFKAKELDDRGISAMLFGQADFPESLLVQAKPLMPVLFYKGNKNLFYEPGVGMCGSRHVSPKGLEAAERCGVAASSEDWTIVSGYAKGVDTATHLAALKSGGRTVIVLAEGIDFFRVKREFAEDFDPERTLVVSQFAPTQTWQAHAAMARNSVIFGLSRALVVIEAGERGGTLAAGHGALKIGRPVLVVDFGDSTPAGNQLLLEAGAEPVRNAAALKERLGELIGRAPTPDTTTLF
jgi:DNA processing protein